MKLKKYIDFVINIFCMGAIILGFFIGYATQYFCSVLALDYPNLLFFICYILIPLYCFTAAVLLCAPTILVSEIGKQFEQLNANICKIYKLEEKEENSKNVEEPKDN